MTSTTGDHPRLLSLVATALLGAVAGCEGDGSRRSRITVGKTVAQVCIDPGLELSDKAVLSWVRDGLEATRGYFTRVGVRRLDVQITATRSNGVDYGSAWSGQVPELDIRVGRGADRDDLARDWVLFHELVHVATPRVGDHKWWREGVATYIEPLARRGAGRIDEARLWRGFYRNMQHGQPGRGDKGLDHTRTWGRTYWGGALWALVADVEIRRQTGNTRGLRDAFVAMAQAGGSIGTQWTLAKALAIGDAAVGRPVLTSLYNRWKNTPIEVDLAQLWRDLGVVRTRSGHIRLDDRAKDAAIRRAITNSTAR